MGWKHFLGDRLKRLGIPLIFYSLVFASFLNWMVDRFGRRNPVSFWNYLHHYHNWINFGVLWFVTALLLFTFIYLLVRPFIKPGAARIIPVPENRHIILFAFALGIISFLVRILFPVGWVLKPLGFQAAHFSQYISMFIIGILAARNHWTEHFNIKKAMPFLFTALAFLFVVFPMMYLIKIVTGCSLDSFSGGGTISHFFLQSGNS